MLTSVDAAAYGAGGGLVVEAVVTFGRLHAWQQARHEARAAARHVRDLPGISAFVDPLADSLAALFRVVLGAAAAWLLHGEVVGVYAAVTVGASAPALLAQIGRAATAADALRASNGSSALGSPVPGSGGFDPPAVHEETAS